MHGKYAPNWLTVLSAIMIVFAFPPWDATPLIWVALAPWLLALRRRAPVASLCQGLWLSFIMTLGGFYWIASVLHEFGGLPWALSIPGLLLFGLICQPQFPIFALLFTHDKFRLKDKPLLAALVYTGLDWAIPKLFLDTLGHSFYGYQNLRQVADLGGAHLLTLLIYLVNHNVMDLFEKLRAKQRPDFIRLVTALAACAAAWTYGLIRIGEIRQIQSKPDSITKAAVIQGNIGDFDKIAAERGIRGAAEKVMSTLIGLSEQAVSQALPDFIIWPETSYPSTFRTPQTSDEMARDRLVEQFVRDRGIPLLFGGYDRDMKKDYNSFFFLSPFPSLSATALPGTIDLQIYHKNILLLFGEYIPGAEYFTFIKNTFPTVGNFGRGRGAEVLTVHPRNKEIGPIKVGPLICYEALFPDFVIKAANDGSQIIMNITNDSWFGPYGEPQLHLALSTFRSIETRLPQIRTTNTGISALILPDGEIAQRTEIGRAEIMNVQVPLIKPVPTLMKKWGDWFGRFAFAVATIWTATGLVFSSRQKLRQSKTKI